jgi:hypothetical protein
MAGSLAADGPAPPRARIAEMPRCGARATGPSWWRSSSARSASTCVSCAGLWLDGGELEQVIGEGEFLSGLLGVFGKK